MKDSHGNLKRVDVYKWVKKEGACHYEKALDYQGKFHSFGMDYEEFESGPGNYSVAIVEKLTGEIEMPRADLIQFVKPNS